jgi:hypothetical protein
MQLQFGRRSFRPALKISLLSPGAENRSTVKQREVSHELEGRDACHHNLF